MIKYHSWDAANKTLAFVDASITQLRVIAENCHKYAEELSGCIGNITAWINLGGDPTDIIGSVRGTIVRIKQWLASIVVIRVASVNDLLSEKRMADVSPRDRALSLKVFVAGVGGPPDTAIAEHQGSRIGNATPTANLAVAHQLCYHYADTPADFVSINPSRKNRIAFAEHLTMEAIAIQHGKKIKKDPRSFTPEQKKAVRKLHTTENMKWFCRVWGVDVLAGVKPGLINHIADAFMQMIAYHFS